MRIAMAASEAAPYIKTGGLGDVLQALPRALADLPENDVALFLPYYKKIKDNPAIRAEFLASFTVNLTWRQQYVGLFRCETGRKNLQVYLIDNEYYFLREGTYGFYDDGERFAYFSKAVLACMNWLDFRPEILLPRLADGADPRLSGRGIPRLLPGHQDGVHDPQRRVPGQDRAGVL